MNEPIYSPGLEGVVAGETAISTIADGLSYRGYSIEDLASHAGFEEVAYLVLNGELPTAEELTGLKQRMADAAELPQAMIDALGALPESANMMDVMRTAASLASFWDPDASDNSHEANVRKAERLLVRLSAAMCARHRLRSGEKPISYDADRSLAGNILHMLRGAEPSERQVQALDTTLILYAEHEFNASTFTARVVCSTQSDIHSSITAAIGTLKGPLHGGANERAIETLLSVGGPENAESWVRDALAKKQRIMGFGHRVYRTGDPRAAFLTKFCREVAEETGHQEMEQAAKIIEKIMREEKNLPPNVDWPCGRLYYYLGLPIDLYTPLFVIGRTSGWCAHVIEQIDNNRLIRPRAKYVGPEARKWKPVEER